MISNIIDRVRLIFKSDKEFRKALHGILGFYPHNLEVYRIALAHKSHVYRNRKGKSFNNERLEFLGDAILEAVVSDIVYHRFERRHEGFLTNTRSKIVQRSSLNQLAKDLGLESLIQVHQHSRGHNSYIGGNALEALIGAAYLDRGFNCCKWFLENRIVGRMLDIEGVANKEVNFKSKLLEWGQKNKMIVEFKLSDSTLDNTGSPVFSTFITIEGITAGEGTGYSKKESQQKAAKEALTRMRKEGEFVESLFEAKEKRTAMEAEEYCDVPKIDEIESMIEEELSNTATDNSSTNPTDTTTPAKRTKTHRGRAKRSPSAKEETTTTTQEKPSNNKKARTKRAPVPVIDEIETPEAESATESASSKGENKQSKPTRAKKAKVANKDTEEKATKENDAPSKQKGNANTKAAEDSKKKTTSRPTNAKRNNKSNEERNALNAAREEQISAAEEAAYADLY